MMAPLTNNDLKSAVEMWQRDDKYHPLTCIQSNHTPLVAEKFDGVIKLRCLDCDYIQDHIPDVVLNNYVGKTIYLIDW
jgi:hypothetical protein